MITAEILKSLDDQLFESQAGRERILLKKIARYTAEKNWVKVQSAGARLIKVRSEMAGR